MHVLVVFIWVEGVDLRLDARHWMVAVLPSLILTIVLVVMGRLLLRQGLGPPSTSLSTYISYACLIAESLSRGDLIEAIHSRRAYAANDNIILDVSYQSSDGQHPMGAIFSSASPARIRANILGAGSLKRVDVIRDGRIL